MSLDESVTREANDTGPTAPTAENGTPTKLCSACGKDRDTLKKCTACKCVWYCGKDCQKRHRKEHKKECKRIKKELDKRGGKLDLGAETDLVPLPDLPPREECPICMRALSIHPRLQGYAACCGKTVCGGCDLQHQVKSRERAAEIGQKKVLLTCAFCRTPMPESDEEILARTRKRVELKDLTAMFSLAMDYATGRLGLPVDQAKFIDLLRESAGLGHPDSQFKLGTLHHMGTMGLEQNEEIALKYYEQAAEGGHLLSRHNLGSKKKETGDTIAAMGHWRLSASGGSRRSIEILILYFEHGLLHHSDLAETLRAMYRARAEMSSADRDQFIEYLKKTGKYDEEYNL